MKNLLLTLIMGLSTLVMLNCSSSDDPVPLLSSIEISSTIGNTLVVNQTAQLSLNGFDQLGDPVAINSTILWSTNNANVTIDQNGRVEALAEGMSVITAETESLTATYQITIESRMLTSILINSTNGDRLDLTETTQLTAQGADQLNTPIAIGSVVTWSVDNEHVSVDSNGLVTALSVGNSVITAQAEGVQGSFTIRVWDSTAPRTEIYVSDVGVNRNGPHQILKYDEEGENGEVFISSNLSRPQDIVFLEDQDMVIISNLQANNITKYDSHTGAYLGVFASGINGPTRVQIGGDNLIYVIQWNGGPVKRYNQDGSFVDDFTDISINEAIGMAWDDAGNLYVSSWGNGTNGFVRRFDTNGNDLGMFINSNLSGPTDIWFDDSGNLLVSDWSGNKIKEFDSDGSFLGDFIATGLTQPEGVGFMNGSILIGNSGNGSVKMYNSEGNFIEDIVKPGAAGLTTTNAVTVRLVNQ